MRDRDENQGPGDIAQQQHELPPVRQITVGELNELMRSDVTYELVDVRTEFEQSLAAIEGFRLLDQVYHDELMDRDRKTVLIFQCHHGIRSQHAAEYFRHQGFLNLYNVQGGIDAWSQYVDRTVRRY